MEAEWNDLTSEAILSQAKLIKSPISIRSQLLELRPVLILTFGLQTCKDCLLFVNAMNNSLVPGSTDLSTITKRYTWPDQVSQ